MRLMRARVSLTTLVEARLTFLHLIRTVERSHLAAPGALIFPITRDLLTFMGSSYDDGRGSPHPGHGWLLCQRSEICH